MLLKTLIGLFICLQIIKLSQQDVCIRNSTLDPGVTYYMYNDDYPNKSTKSSCIFYATAENDYQVSVECSIETNTAGGKCGVDKFYISTNGDLTLRDAEVFCGSGDVNRTSTFGSIAVAYKASADETSEGRFLCYAKATPSSCDCGWTQSERIIDGEDAHEGEFPSVVGIYGDEEGDLFCGGTIISHRLVLSAKHCFKSNRKPENIFILAGLINKDKVSKYTVVYTVQKIIIHPRTNNRRNDIALLKTTKPIEWSRGVAPACLPFWQKNATFFYTDVILLGWGYDKHHNRPSILQKVQVQVVTNSKCSKYYPDIHSKQICTFTPGKDACQFDSGGPVFHVTDRQVLIGIISYGKTCADDSPGVNTRVSSYLDWIESKSEDKLCYKKFI